jgi:hypothetical protein
MMPSLPPRLGLIVCEYAHISFDILFRAHAALSFVRYSHFQRQLDFSSQGKEGDSPDRIKMIMTAFAAFTSIATAIQSNQREDVRSVAILLYSGTKHRISCSDHRPDAFTELLKDESSEIDLVGPTLPALKALLGIPVYNAPDAKNKFGRLVHGLLSACLLHVDEMR